MSTIVEAPNPFVIYNRLVGSVASSSTAFVDLLQATFNLTGALTATTALGTTALVLAPPIGVAIACLGTVAFKVYALVKDNDDFKEILTDLLFVMKQLERIDPCPKSQIQTESCQYVKRHLIIITEILNLFIKLPSQVRLKTLTPSQFTNQLLREFTLLNAGLTVILLEANKEPVEAVVTVLGESKSGGAINFNDPAMIEEANKLLNQINQETDEIIRENVTQGGKRARTRRNKRKKNRRTKRR